jgi:hypothetical protein
MNFHSKDSSSKDGDVHEAGLQEARRRSAPPFYSTGESASGAAHVDGALPGAYRSELREQWHRKFAKLGCIVAEFSLSDCDSVEGRSGTPSMTSRLMDSFESTLRAARAYPREDGRSSVEAVGRLALEVVGKWIQMDRSPRATTVVSGLVIALQGVSSLLAVEVAHAAIEAGGRLSAPTVLCTIAHATRNATCPENIGVIYRFAQEALTRGLVPVSSSKTVGFYNVLLAVAGAPVPNVGRVGPAYRDVDSLDVAERLLNAAPLALSAIDANLPFSDRETEGRINLFLRALCSASLILDVEQVRIWESLSPSEVLKLRREIGADKQLRAHISEDRRDADLLKPARALVSQALLLAESALEVMKRADHNRPLRYEIRGSTINLLSNAAFFCEELSVDQTHRLLSIVSTALELPRVRRKMYSASIENAVLTGFSAAYGSEERPGLLLHACSTFVSAMRKGFTFSDGLMSRVRDAYEEVPLADRADISVLEDVAYLEMRLARTSRKSLMPNRHATKPSQTQTLEGGLPSGRSRFIRSFADLQQTILAENGAKNQEH